MSRSAALFFMSRSQQAWPLSQDANKASGICSVCRARRQLHHKDGTVHNHGPRKKPCPGSNKPPLAVVDSSSASLSSTHQPNDDASQQQVAQASQIQPSGTGDDGADWQPISFGTVKHIPRSARVSCASHLAGLLRTVANRAENPDNWIALFRWAGSILQPPKRGGKRHNLTSVLKKRIQSFSGTVAPICEVPTQRRKSDTETQLAQAVASKLEDGNLRAAIRILCSDDAPVIPSDESLAQLQAKHPAATSMDPALSSTNLACLSVTEDDVRGAIQSFPAGSSGGPDGLRPQHLKDVLQTNDPESGFLSAITGFVNMVLAGCCPPEITKYFFGGRLIALRKKQGGIRPIAVGFTLRRLVSKCASLHGIAHLKEYFQPLQLGVGVPGGCEAAIHSTRRFLSTLPSNYAVVKLDFANAFNNIRRSDMLLAVKERLPELFSYCYSAYSTPSYLFHGQNFILSQEGTQQGDPLGPLLFSNSIHPLLSSLTAVLNIGYLDDLTLGGPIDSLASDVRRIIEVGSSMGLILNSQKCEIITHPGQSVEDPIFKSFVVTPIADTSLLGAPLFVGSVLDEAWASRCADLVRATERLKMVEAQDALILLRCSFSAPRVQHLLRCSPSLNHPSLSEFDATLRSAICGITNCDLTDTQWLQASLPIKDGGLGVRRVTTLALPAFLASAAGTLSLQDSILTSHACPPDSTNDRYLNVWSQSGLPVPPAPLDHKQSAWDRPGIVAVRTQIEDSITDVGHRAQFLAATAPHTGDWLLSLPISQCGLKLDNEAVRVGVALRLGLDLGVPHLCRCGANVDATGIHAFVCRHAPGRIARHQALNDAVCRALGSASCPATKEPTGLVQQDGRRPDGMSLIPWQTGKILVWDVTVICTLADSYVDLAAQESGMAAGLAARRKKEKYSDLPTAYTFLPIAFENLGTLDSEAADFVSAVGRKISNLSGDRRETSFLFQRLSVILQRYNSILYRDTFHSSLSIPDL